MIGSAADAGGALCVSELRNDAPVFQQMNMLFLNSCAWIMRYYAFTLPVATICVNHVHNCVNMDVLNNVRYKIL